MQKTLEKEKGFGKCRCGGEIKLDKTHREFVCMSCGRIHPKPRGNPELKPTRYLVLSCINCQAKKRNKRYVTIVEYNWSGWGRCPLCGYKYRFD